MLCCNHASAPRSISVVLRHCRSELVRWLFGHQSANAQSLWRRNSFQSPLFLYMDALPLFSVQAIEIREELVLSSFSFSF